MKNPQGLDEILSTLLPHHEPDDWDRDIPTNIYLGKIPKEDVDKILPGRKGAFWGQTFELHASNYLKKHLEKHGWHVITNYMVQGYEYDLVAWKTEQSTVPDLHVEFHFPQLKKFPYHLDLDEKMTADKNKLERIGARNRFILLGIPHNSEIQIEQTESPHFSIKLQEYRFRFTQTEKRKSSESTVK